MEATAEKEFDIAALATRDVERSKEDARAGLTSEDQFLTFTIKNDLYGIDILHIKEILSYTNIAKVPMTPDYLKGVMNLRGNVVPVIELARRFSQATEPLTKLSCIIIIEVDQTVGEPVDIGIVVGSVDKVVAIAKVDMEKSPEFGTKIRPEFIKFMGKVEDSFVPVLSIPHVLNMEELAKFDIAYEKFHKLEKKMKDSIKNAKLEAEKEMKTSSDEEIQAKINK